MLRSCHIRLDDSDFLRGMIFPFILKQFVSKKKCQQLLYINVLHFAVAVISCNHENEMGEQKSPSNLLYNDSWRQMFSALYAKTAAIRKHVNDAQFIRYMHSVM